MSQFRGLQTLPITFHPINRIAIMSLFLDKLIGKEFYSSSTRYYFAGLIIKKLEVNIFSIHDQQNQHLLSKLFQCLNQRNYPRTYSIKRYTTNPKLSRSKLAPRLFLMINKKNFVSVKKQIEALRKNRVKVELEEKDIEESIAKGWGPGGQAVNKTNNAVCLVHRPTGIQVKSHKTRDLQLNRKDARKRLLAALDSLNNGGASISAIKQLRVRSKKHSKRRKSRIKYAKKDSSSSTSK